MFDWLRRHRRRRLLETPFPNEWTDTLRRNVKHYVCLIASEQAKLRDDLRILVAEKNWEGCCGLTIDDEIKVTIAAQASLLLLGFRNKYFDLVRSILVYPDAFVAPDRTDLESGLVLEGESTNEGEAWYRGPVVLSWPDALSGGRGESDGRNLVVHEFAHQLDMESGGEVDGTPVLGNRIPLDRWHRVMHAEFERLVRDCRRGRKTTLDPYGTTDMGEFFAVATECFFEQPLRLQELHPNLYELLGEFFRQDPAMRSIPGHPNPLD
ncbi:MAG: zinc-dependent peptidase [Planctomycetia bacterium]|nr:zinc-dependent peptidase [Planctomycetia bacterium]